MSNVNINLKPETDVNKEFSKLLESAELTEEQIGQINDTVEEAAEASPSISHLREIQEREDDVPVEGETVSVRTIIDPATGKIQQTVPADETFGYDTNMSFEEMLAGSHLTEDEADPMKTPLNYENVKESILEEFPQASVDDIMALMRLTEKYRLGEKFPYYNELPDSIKKELDRQIGPEMMAKAGKQLKGMRNYATEEFMKAIINDNFIKQAAIDLNTSIASEIKDMRESVKKPLADYNRDIRIHFEEHYLKLANEIESENPEKAELLRAVSKAYTSARTLAGFKEAVLGYKVRVKPIQLEKLTRTCEEFNRKYQNSKEVIRDIKLTLPILKRHLTLNGYFDDSFSDADKDTAVGYFTCAFVNYTKNMKPSVLEQHVFMYYVINNICQLDFTDANDEEAVKIDKELLSSIQEIISHYIKEA